MERHRCKLCWRRFDSGRALGGHMRSHVMNPSLYPDQCVAKYTESDSLSSEVEEDEVEEKTEEVEKEEEEEGESLTESVIVQDRESESDQISRRIMTRRRSKRLRPASAVSRSECGQNKKLKCEVNKSESLPELEQGSSVSDSSVEDVAYCLMMLSRDKWDVPEDDHHRAEPEVEVDSDDNDDDDDSTKLPQKMMKVVNEQKPTVVKDRYTCEICLKVFGSYQALGGHKASHNKIKQTQNSNLASSDTKVPDSRIHQCPVCRRIFASGQALGGHKRSHAMMVLEIVQPVKATMRCGSDIVIDLNFPAPDEEDGVQQF